MTRISLIAAIDENRGLGKANQLLCHLPADLKHFKSLTQGKPIVMGRRTYESIGRPLPNRQNIVLSKTMSPLPGIDVVASLEQAMSQAGKVKEIMIIGGEALFREALPIADRLYITHIHGQFNADVYFPIIDESKWWCVAAQKHLQDAKNPYDLTFCQYTRISLINK